MQLYVKGGLVVAIHDDGQSVDPIAAYGAGATVQTLTPGEPVPRLFDPAPAPDLRVYAATARYARETAGITVGTAPIATDRESQAMITGLWAAAQINPDIAVSFKSHGGFVTIGADQVRKIASAVAAHVQACFATEAQVAASIAAGTVKTATDVDLAFAAVTA